MTIRAVIVGIETYGGCLEEVVSPAENALLMAAWAITHGITRDDVYLFVAAADPTVEDRIRGMGLVNRGATLHQIENVLRKELACAAAGGIEPGSKLFFYWSGHGMTDTRGQRLLFCADYSSHLIDRVFNASLFFRDLRTDEYEGYRTMLALADVCGTNSQLRVRPADYDPDTAHKRNHLIYFATPEGGYARARTGEGAFTHLALQALESSAQFPDLALFRDRVQQELEESGLPRFLVDYRSEDDEWEQRRFGKFQPSTDQRANSLIELLVDLELLNAEAEKAYRATVWTLKNSRIPPAAGITGSVRELSALDAVDGQAPGGLVQYVLRLAESLPDHESRLMAWLDRYADKAVVLDERARIDETRGANLLIIWVVAGSDGRIQTLEPRLRHRETAMAIGPLLKNIDIRADYGVELAIADLLRTLEANGFLDLEIHFLVDANVLDYPFHRLPSLEEDVCLGQAFGVVLHHRERYLKARTPAKRFWENRAKGVSTIAPANLSWTRCSEGQQLPTEADLCLAGWLPSAQGKKILAKLLYLGVPYIYWPLVDGEPDAEPGLTQTIRSLHAHSGIADAMLRRRIADGTTTGSMLWDDVDFKP